MIPVSLKSEYPEFDAQVRQPGKTFLEATPSPTSAQFKRKNYWTRSLAELHAAYSGICAYTSMYLPDRGSVDHYWPKTAYPELAYEWSNFRLANGRINSTKGNSLDVLDPFDIGDDWFCLDIPSCLIRANAELGRAVTLRINRTINSLRLNSDDTHVQERCNILIALAKGDVMYQFLEQRYPFLAREIDRQGLRDQLAAIFKL